MSQLRPSAHLENGEDVSVAAGPTAVGVAEHLVLVEDVEGVVGQAGQHVDHESGTEVVPANFLLQKGSR